VSLWGADDDDAGTLRQVRRPHVTGAFEAPGGGVVNGLRGEVLDWHAIDWRAVEDAVRRLRQRIFTASQAGDTKGVRNLQKLMLRSRANTLLSVRRVTERNAGRMTAGIDGQVTVSARDKAALVAWVHDQSLSWAGSCGQAGVHPQSWWQAAPTGHSRDR
jgi:RNA-directed DNA polymerase